MEWRRRFPKGTGVLALIVAVGLALGCAPMQSGPSGDEPEREVTATPETTVEAEEDAGVSAAAEPPGGFSAADIPSSADLPPIPIYPPPQSEPGKRTIAIDPGHGGWEVGAAHRGYNGETPIQEKNINLQIGLKLRDLLEGAGYRVVMTRDSDQILAPGNEEMGRRRTRVELQARVNQVNEARADLFVSIHNNGSTSASQSGTEVWYSKDRPFAAQNLALARLLQENIVRRLRAIGHDVVDRGVKDDSSFRIWQGRRFNLFVLGPPRNEPSSKTATLMPGALGESLFVTNPTEASLLRRERTLDAIAQGYFDGIEGYFQLIDSGELSPPPSPEEVAATERPVSPAFITSPR